MPVEVSPQQVLIREHTITEAAVVAEFNSALAAGKDPAEFLSALVSLGAQVVALGSNTASAEKIDASVDQARLAIREVAESFEQNIQKQVAGFVSEEGSLITGFNAIIDQFRDGIEEMTAGEDSPLRSAMLKSLDDAKDKIHHDIKTQVSDQKREIAQLLDPASPTSPLRSLSDKLDALGGAVERVQLEVAKEIAVAEIVEGGVVGGIDYEDEAVAIVQRIAAMAGDDCEPTGHVTGRVARSKKGDGVVDLKVGATVADRIVVEAKNSALTKLDWERECGGSKENRAANGFIGLCKHLDDMPNASRIMILDSRSIVLAFDPEHDDAQLLYLVYQMIKLNTLSSSGRLDEVNIVEVRRSLDDALKALERFDNLTKSASAIENSAASIKKDALAIRSIIAERLGDAKIAMSLEANLEELRAPEAAALEAPEDN
jgi:hypothetical protein